MSSTSSTSQTLPAWMCPWIRPRFARTPPAQTARIKSGNNCETGNYYYVNYGQIVTSNSPGDQQSALANLDELPYSTGSGKALNVPLTIPLNATGGCITGGSNVLSASQGCPNNAATFGSVSNTIGGNRVITMGIHITY